MASMSHALLGLDLRSNVHASRPATLGDMLAKLTAEEQTNGPTLINILLLTYHDYASIKEIMDWLQKRCAALLTTYV